MKRFLGFASLFATLTSIFSPSNGEAFTYCPTCGLQSNFSGVPYYSGAPSFMNMNYPWWGGYGAMSYPNFYSPGVWGGGGMNGGFYPGGGSMFAAKPNVYVTAPVDTEISVKLQFPPTSTWLNATPVHGSGGWKARVRGPEKLEVDGSSYRFFYYDFRHEHQKLQNRMGFCTTREEFVPKVSRILKEEGFLPSEIKDFEIYWQLKLPQANRYCVYPQTEAELSPIAPLEILPQPRKVTRLLFVVTVDEGKGLNPHFSQDPGQPWKRNSSEGKNNNDSLASDSKVEIREWGVAFVANNSSVSPKSQGKDSRAVVLGQLQPQKDCEKDEAHAWLSLKQNLLYHMELPVNGTFEFHTIPGDQNLVITTSSGCFVEKVLHLKDGETQKLILTPKK